MSEEIKVINLHATDVQPYNEMFAVNDIKVGDSFIIAFYNSLGFRSATLYERESETALGGRIIREPELSQIRSRLNF